MLRKVFASLLVILAALPFTAPFAVFDLASASHSAATSLDTGSHALPSFAASARMRTRFVSRLDVSASTGRAQSPAVPLVCRTHTEDAPAVHSSLTALRI
jgi:hypothetical protein